MRSLAGATHGTLARVRSASCARPATVAAVRATSAERASRRQACGSPAATTRPPFGRRSRKRAGHRGVGHGLMAAMAERARAAGLHRWMLHVKPENLAARALYERCGMSVTLASVSMRMAWADVARMALVPRALGRPLAPTDDSRFEDAFALSRGEISAFRDPGRRVLVGAEDSEGPAGVVAFDPSLPGASLLRVRAPEYARALLDALRPHALSGHHHLLLFVEGDAALEAALAGAGAETAMRALRMEGKVPAE
jgi:hypothetical protein